MLHLQKKEKKSKKKEKKTEEEAEAPKEETSGGDDGEPKRAQRATSNVFALFNQSQIQEFKEVCISRNVHTLLEISIFLETKF